MPPPAAATTYWESRFETPLGDSFARTAKEVILLDHSPADGHLDQIISPTIFSVKTNRRLFRGMVHLTETQGWQRAFQVAEKRSRWDLPLADVEGHLSHSFEFIMAMLAEPAIPSRAASIRRGSIRCGSPRGCGARRCWRAVGATPNGCESPPRRISDSRRVPCRSGRARRSSDPGPLLPLIQPGAPGSMTGKVQDLMVGAKVTKAMAQEEKSLSDFNKVNVANAKAQIKAEVTANIYEATVGFFAALISTLIWFFGGQQVLGAYLAIGDLVAFTQYTTSYLEPIQNISTFYGEIQSALAGAERIFVVLDIDPEVKEAPDAVDFPEGEGIVELKDVRFSYVKDQPVLKGINIKTRPGGRLAIFGPTGSGKSSIINLVGRFYDPDSGAVTIDGVDLRKVKLKALRRKVGIVLQEPYLFQGTLRYNLKFGRPDACEEEMIRVAKLVGIHDPITRLPKGYDEEVRERGSNLSYGQRQLVCLARALISDPKILILDEATSSVDPYTEQLIQNALKVEMEHRTDPHRHPPRQHGQGRGPHNRPTQRRGPDRRHTQPARQEERAIQAPLRDAAR